MNTKHFPNFSIIILLILIFVSCSSEDPSVVCKTSEYDCDYQHRIPGIVTITKGSSRVHYILTQKGLQKSEIKEGEPVAYNPETGAAVIKETTDSSIDILIVNAKNGKIISPEIPLKPEKTLSEKGKNFYAFPKLLSACVQNDGTIVLLVRYENLLSNSEDNPKYSEADPESIHYLYVYEKGDVKKLKKHIFPQNEPAEGSLGDYFWEEPKYIQCTGKDIYLFSEKNHVNEVSLFHGSQPVWILSRIDLDSTKDDSSIIDTALLAYDDITFNYYSKKENRVYTTLHSSEKEKTVLRITSLKEGYELPEIPVEKEGGEFLFSATSDGTPLIFFVKTRSHLEEQRIELLPL